MAGEQEDSLHCVENLLRSLSAAVSVEQHQESDAIFMPGTLSERERIRYLCRTAEDSKLPQEILERLVYHPCPEVREAVSDNPGLSIEALHHLAHDECADVRYAIAENHNTPSNLLYELGEDENPYVSQRAQHTLERLQRSCRFASNTLLKIEILNTNERSLECSG